ncbi:MAG: hypothetical protein WCH75_29880 [Candidatus Binatia bacterium]
MARRDLARPIQHDHKESAMSKGQDRKKDEKKKPQKTLMEKRAAKRAKKENQGTFSIAPATAKRR